MKKEFPTDAELHRIADEFASIAAANSDASFTVKHRGHYYHAGCTEFDIGGVYYRETEEELKHVARHFMYWIYDSLQREYEYQTGEEVSRELCENAGEVFNENGDYV